jgi:hypothetical protein
MGNRTKKYGKPLNKYPKIRPVLKNDKPSGDFAIVDGKKERMRGKLNDLIEKL